MPNIASCCGSAEGGRAKRPLAEVTSRSLQAKLERGSTTRSPTLTFSTPGPTARTRPTPSLPMTDGSYRGPDRIDALRGDHEVIGIDRREFDAR